MEEGDGVEAQKADIGSDRKRRRRREPGVVRDR